ncbi:hypothetical protein FRB98_001716 [Tulasnella sp. 332]|nr:hypothetical protein FRB98_001716 [Tulasnella sp. 332]
MAKSWSTSTPGKGEVQPLHDVGFIGTNGGFVSSHICKVMLITGFQTQRLHEIHNRGVLHRDIKPISICGGLMQEQTIFYLIDFGLDKAYRPRGVHIARRKDLSPLGHPPGPALRSIDPIPKVVAATSSHQPMRPSTFGKGVFPGVSWWVSKRSIKLSRLSHHVAPEA